MVLLCQPVSYGVTGTVIVSDMAPSSKSVRVASPNVTSPMSAVHWGFGHDPGGAEGAAVVRALAPLNVNWPFCGVGRDKLPAAVVVKV